MRRVLACLLLLLCLPAVALAISGKGTTAAAFLKISVGPRAVAMGEAYAGVADEVNAVYWNPAGLAQLRAPEITAMHVFWFEDIYFDHLAWALPLEVGVLGASLVYLNGGTLQRSEAGDTPDDPARGTFSAADVGFTGAYALPINEHMHLGLGVVLFSENIDSQASLGWAANLGFLYHLPWEGWRLGAVVQNLGPATRVEEEYFRLPINFKVGMAYTPVNEVLLTLDYNQLLEQYGKISFGVEYVFENSLAIRAGYLYQEKIDPAELYSGFGSNAVAGLSAGMGITYLNLRLDYAFVPYGFLGTTHRISMTYAFNQALATPTPAPTPAPTPVPTALPTPAAVAQRQALESKFRDIQRRIELGILQNIQFASGSMELTAGSLSTLNEIAAELMPFPELTVRIEGHTDSQGPADGNQRLSQRRVNSVKQYLVEHHGLNPAQLVAIGYGEKRPVADNATPAGRRQNRRVEFKVLNIE